MRKAITKTALLVLMICGSYAAFEAQACTCMPQRTPYREFQDARAVFVGKVISSRDVAVTERGGAGTHTIQERIFKFSVSESLKGLKTSTVDISVGPVDSSCYQGFGVGESYLVYAFGDSERSLGSGACRRTTNLSYATGELHYIRNLLKGVPEPRVYGSVIRVDSDLAATESTRRVTPLAGIKVLIEGKDKTYETVTDQQGLFRLARVPDGKYRVRPQLPEKYMTYFPDHEEFNLAPKYAISYERIQQGPSAYASFEIGWNNRLKGRIVDSEGNPIVRAKVSVLLARSPSPLFVQGDRYDHHAEGKFWFYGLNPGSYILSVDIRAPFTDNERATTFYYPNAATLDQAREISIGENETIDEREIRLPPGYVVRRIEGVLTWPNGEPVSNGWVSIAAKNVADDKAYDWGSTDLLGRFSLQAFVGAEYWVHGESNSSGKGEPVKIKVEMTNEPLKIVIPFPKANEP